MTLEEQLKDLQEKLDMTQAIKHGGQICDMLLQCLLPGDPRNQWQLAHLRNSS